MTCTNAPAIVLITGSTAFYVCGHYIALARGALIIARVKQDAAGDIDLNAWECVYADWLEVPPDVRIAIVECARQRVAAHISQTEAKISTLKNEVTKCRRARNKMRDVLAASYEPTKTLQSYCARTETPQ